MSDFMNVDSLMSYAVKVFHIKPQMTNLSWLVLRGPSFQILILSVFSMVTEIFSVFDHIRKQCGYRVSFPSHRKQRSQL